jgi:hypothetical protein
MEDMLNDALYNIGSLLEKYKKLQDVLLEQEKLATLKIKLDA